MAGRLGSVRSIVTPDTQCVHADLRTPVAGRVGGIRVTLHWEGTHFGRFDHAKCAGKVRGIEAYYRDRCRCNGGGDSRRALVSLGLITA